jgi:hypothetical protein
MGPFARPHRIVNVAVRDQDFQLVRVLEAERDLIAFRALWASLVDVDRDVYTWQRGQPYYKLAIESIGPGGRADNDYVAARRCVTIERMSSRSSSRQSRMVIAS